MKFIMKFLVALISIVFIRCADESNSVESFTRGVLQNVVDGDYDMLRSYNLDNLDTSAITDSLSLRIVEYWLDTEEDYEIYDKLMQEEIKLVTKLAEVKTKNKSIRYLRTQVDTIVTSIGPSIDMKVYFLIDNTEHFFILNTVVQSIDKFSYFKISSFTTQTESDSLALLKRAQEAKRIYKPPGLEFHSCDWTNFRDTPKTFSKFFLTLRNSTKNRFKRLSFRLYFFDSEGRERFSKLINRNIDISPGDMFKFEIE